MWGTPQKPNPVKGTGRVRMVPHQDGTPGFEMLDEYTEVLPAGVPWGRLLVSFLMAGVLVLIVLGALASWGWLTGGGFTVTGTTCATHLAHSPLPSALPSVPVK